MRPQRASKVANFAFLLFGVVFSGAAVLIFFLLVLPPIQDKDIAKNGTAATATITGYDSNMSENDVAYYHFTLSLNGRILKTNSSYSEYDLPAIGTVGKEVQIRFKGDKAVIDGFEYKGPGAKLLVPIPFAGVGIGMSAAFIMIMYKEIRNRRILANGDAGTGTYISHSSNTTVNGVSLYKLVFSFTDEYGQLNEIKTGSIYTAEEVGEIADIKTFPIKYRGKIATIDFEEIEEARFKQNLEKESQKKDRRDF